MHGRTAASALFTSLLLMACGQKGPLYLPEQTTTVIRPSPTSQTPPSPGAADPATPPAAPDATKEEAETARKR